MNEFILGDVSKSMSEMGLEYGFMSYRKNKIVYPYFVGKYSEADGDTEDGMQECTFMLTGFSRGSGGLLALEQAKEKIRKYFTRQGRRFRHIDGSVAVVMYGNAFSIEKEDAELKSIQINLTVKEWSV